MATDWLVHELRAEIRPHDGGPIVVTTIGKDLEAGAIVLIATDEPANLSTEDLEGFIALLQSVLERRQAL